jgi:ABC-type branched-subunit amino acid transport system permease subunit
VLSVSLASDIGITLIAALGLCIVSGLCGQINFGQPAFMAMGAYVSGIFSTRWGLPFPLALLSAGLLAAMFGLVFGLPALRLKGLYLVVATLCRHDDRALCHKPYEESDRQVRWNEGARGQHSRLCLR